MAENLLIPLQFTYPDKSLQSVLKAHIKKMDTRLTTPGKIIEVLEVIKF